MKKGEQRSGITINISLPKGHSGYWGIIKELDALGGWSINNVAHRTNDNRNSILDFVKRLVRAAYAEECGLNDQGHKQYRLLKRPHETPRLRRDGSECPELQNATLWRSIRMAKTFSMRELEEITGIKGTTIEKYILQLTGCSILQRLPDGRKGKEAEFRLVRDLGAIAPQILRTDAVFDPNSRQVVGEAIAKEVMP